MNLINKQLNADAQENGGASEAPEVTTATTNAPVAEATPVAEAEVADHVAAVAEVERAQVARPRTGAQLAHAVVALEPTGVTLGEVGQRMPVLQTRRRTIGFSFSWGLQTLIRS